MSSLCTLRIFRTLEDVFGKIRGLAKDWDWDWELGLEEKNLRMLH